MKKDFNPKWFWATLGSFLFFVWNFIGVVQELKKNVPTLATITIEPLKDTVDERHFIIGKKDSDPRNIMILEVPALYTHPEVHYRGNAFSVEIGADTFLMTCRHLGHHDDSIYQTAATYDTALNKEYRRKYGIDKDSVKIHYSKAYALGKFAVGDSFTVIGYKPFPPAYRYQKVTISGEIVCVDGFYGFRVPVWFDGRGLSGSPVLNEQQEAIGVYRASLTLTHNDTQKIVFGIFEPLAFSH